MHLLYLPHCPKTLYQNVLSHNFSPRLCQSGIIILGNDLAEYVLDAPPIDTDGFSKTKKKRAERTARLRMRGTQDGVLERIGERHRLIDLLRFAVPHLSNLPLSTLPDTHLPGFARAFLSLTFQWLDEDKRDLIDWTTPLPLMPSEDSELA